MNGKPIQVIVNADDLGLSQEVNEAVFDFAASGRVTSATIMANAPATLDAVGHVKQFPHISFGVHLNLTQFEPLSAGPNARLLVDDGGQMSRAIERATASLALLRASYEEWSAQVQRLLTLGVPITHFDSHHHVHSKPQYFPVLKAVQRRFRIRKVRLSKNLYGLDRPATPSLLRKKRAYNWALRHVYRTQTTGAFTELTTFHDLPPAQISSATSIELMVHPAAPYARPEEDLLRSEWVERSPVPIRLISYAELGR